MTKTDPDIPDFNEFRRYADGTMPSVEQHRLEKRMLDDPLVADAYEGFLLWYREHADAIPPGADLQRRLAARSARRRPLVPLWAYGAAASVLISVSFLGFYFFNAGPSERVVVTGRPVNAESDAPSPSQDKKMNPDSPPRIVAAPPFPEAIRQEEATPAGRKKADIAVPKGAVAALADEAAETVVVRPAPDSATPGAALPVQAFEESLAARSKPAPSAPQTVSQRAKSETTAGQPLASQPVPAAGWTSYRAYLDSTIRLVRGQGDVTIYFFVNPDATLSDFETSGDDALKEDALRIVKQGPAWAPMLLGGRAIRSKAQIDLHFRKSQ